MDAERMSEASPHAALWRKEAVAGATRVRSAHSTRLM